MKCHADFPMCCRMQQVPRNAQGHPHRSSAAIEAFPLSRQAANRNDRRRAEDPTPQVMSVAPSHPAFWSPQGRSQHHSSSHPPNQTAVPDRSVLPRRDALQLT
ncbi:hypothetical protein PMIN04_008699 [Paraphaeosphaeria minitans]